MYARPSGKVWADHPVACVVLIAKNQVSILHHRDHPVVRIVRVIRYLPVRILDADQAATRIVAVVETAAAPVSDLRDSVLLVILNSWCL